MDQAGSVVQRLRELTVQAATGTNPQSALDSINKEVKQLKAQLIDISNSTLNGKYVLTAKPMTLSHTISQVRMGHLTHLALLQFLPIQARLILLLVKLFNSRSMSRAMRYLETQLRQITCLSSLIPLVRLWLVEIRRNCRINSIILIRGLIKCYLFELKLVQNESY